MSKYIMVVNCGSSSLKFNIFELKAQNRLYAVLQGVVEEIGNGEKSRLKYSADGKKNTINMGVNNHSEALSLIFSELDKYNIGSENICAVGHRVVHGGDKYNRSVRIDESVIKTIRDLIPIAPLHNPPNLTGIEESMKLLPKAPQVAVFDTAFHATLPEYAFRYAVPEHWYKTYGVRKYGFHGTSHMYVAKRGAKLLGIPFSEFNGITAHLGNGCSITKIKNGQSVDTSMGFTPLQGVVMGTRSGDIDPAVISYVAKHLAEEKGMVAEEAYITVMRCLNKESGLKALTGTNMMQEIREKALNGDIEAELAVLVYAYAAAKYIGQYWASLPYTNAIIFTAGLGENEGYVRKKIMSFLPAMAVSIDDEKNSIRKQEVVIGKSSTNYLTPLSVMVIPTDEEIVIGYDTLYLGHMNIAVPDKYPFEA